MENIIWAWLDSRVIGHSLTPRQIIYLSKILWIKKWTFWKKSVVKLYYELTENDLKKYHEIHNKLRKTLLRKFKYPIVFCWKKYNSILLHNLYLSNRFIKSEELLKTYKKQYQTELEDIFLSYGEPSSISIQSCVKWLTFRELIENEYNNKKDIDLINPLWTFHNTFLDNSNIKIIWYKTDKLIWVITDSANSIKDLLQREF